MTSEEFANLITRCKSFSISPAPYYVGSERIRPDLLNVMFTLEEGWTVRQITLETFINLLNLNLKGAWHKAWWEQHKMTGESYWRGYAQGVDAQKNNVVYEQMYESYSRK